MFFSTTNVYKQHYVVDTEDQFDTICLHNMCFFMQLPENSFMNALQMLNHEQALKGCIVSSPESCPHLDKSPTPVNLDESLRHLLLCFP